MNDVSPIDLVYDPHRIYAGEGQRVASLSQEIAAFHAIGETLRQPGDPGTRRPRTYILDRIGWEHFRSVRGLSGVRLREFTPRRQIKAAVGAEPPDWLTDDAIVGCKLLQRPGPGAMVQANWAATVAEWVLPGITDASSFQEWLVRAASATDVSEPLGLAPLTDWLSEQVRLLAASTIPMPDVVADLAEHLRESASPVTFANRLLRRRALLPLTRPAIDRPLTVPGLPSESPQDLARAGYLTLPFPLPDPMHGEISRLMCRAVRSAQIERPDTFERAVANLDALWDGVDAELDRWLQVNPRGMTEAAGRHLAGLPGYAASETAQRLVRLFAPPAPVARWTDLDESFDQWVNTYGSYIERMFYRRTLPPEGEDPAAPFAKWVKANPTVFFNHPERGYLTVAGTVQKTLQAGRPVILILVDALAIHVIEAALAEFGKALGASPTQVRYSFCPVPTITAVCKEAILGGMYPEQCHGNLQQTLLKRYGLTPDQLQLAAHWQDAERVRVTRSVRLLVHRDNRLDEQLSTYTNYHALRESFTPIVASLARLVQQWVEVFKHWHSASPLVMLTGDHGFTFGPKPEKDGEATDGLHRCVELGDRKPDDAELRDESLTFLDRKVFHLRGSYLVARGRSSGHGTMSGWWLSHGGLLPEEVIVPVVEWFGDQQALPFPELSVPDGAVRDQGRWIFNLLLANNQPVPTSGGRIRVTPVGEGAGVSVSYPPLRPGTTHTLAFEVPGADLPTAQELVFEVTLSPRSGDSPAPDVIRHMQVARARQFVERTQDQAAFEDMF
ncbi:hypothetical protein J8F10_08720 [Gemmata sp. G18]|uniref:PglZ domain-containing protein n=1 Tax=Gemmata palustris TaxID=2822762 RepID=A0ABS5BNX6_9BACT|nr:hypothetical protein [Gemmata palustris]MBP3955361.1 hypothetical protein [Gemmata palustris]